jgi:hypothetical protein
MPRTKRSRMVISPVHVNAAAIDIWATVHVAAVGPDRDPEPVRSFGTFTGDLHRLADWFKQCGVSTVAMESAGVYWIPVFEILEQLGFTVVLVNARDAKHVPGRKTDVPMHNGCGVCTSMDCCEPAFVQNTGSPHCATICASANGCWTLRPRTSGTCRRH